MCKRNARQTPEGPPVRCHTGLPIQFLYTLRFGALSIAFRVAGFGRADLTLFPEMSPVTCEGDTALMLASCKGFTFYQIAKVGKWLSLPMSLRTMPIDSWHLPP